MQWQNASDSVPKLANLFGDFLDEPQEKEDIFRVLKTLTTGHCRDCRLYFKTQDNKGILWSGNPEAHIAIVGDTPSAGDVHSGKAFADDTGNTVRRWLRRGGINEKDVFYTYIVQCPTPKAETKKAGPDEDKAPQWEKETGICFPKRCLRALQSMPNLEVVLCLGLVTVRALLGGQPKASTHLGFWYGTDILPDVAVYGLPHPRDLNVQGAEVKKGRLRQWLTYFSQDYYGRVNEGGEILIPPKKILTILKQRQQERRESR